MLKKITAAFLALAVVCAFALPVAGSVCDAKGGRAGGYSRSAAPKLSAPKAFAPKSNTSGYKSKSSAPAASTKGNTTTTQGGGKVTSAGGNTSGYKSKQTQTKEKAMENAAKKDTSSSSSRWYGGTNNHYYSGSSDGGIGHFATGMVFGSLLSSPWHVYAGAPGYVGAYSGAPGVAATGGFYSPLSGLLGVIVWLIEWTIIIGLLVAAWLFIRKWWRNRKKK